MSRKSLIITIRRCLLALATVAVVSPLCDQASIMAQTQPNLALTLEVADKTQFVLGEPVYLRIALRNDGGDSAAVFNLLRPGDGLVIVTVTGPDGSVVGFSPLSISDVDDPPQTLAPGAEIAAVFPVFYGAAGWTFTSPGNYSAVATYDVSSGPDGNQLRSDPVTITISSDDADAGSFLLAQEQASEEIGKFFTWQSGDHLRGGIAQLENMLDRYPQSTLADYANFAIGKSLSYNFADYTVGRTRPPDCEKALARMARANPATLPVYLQIQKDLAEAACHIRLGQREPAAASLHRARQLINGRPEYLGFGDQMARLERALAGMQ